MVNKTEEVVGVECGLCHEEAFQLVPREVTHLVDVCPRCVNRIDIEQVEKEMQKSANGLTKAERRCLFQEQSFEWADKLHGKKVIVFWDENTNPYNITHYECQVKGTAYRTANECGGWGKLKVVIDSTEYHRITYLCHYTLYCETVKQDMFFTAGHCYNVKCPEMRLSIDGQRFGLPLGKDNSNGFYTEVSWGCRKVLIQE